MAMITEENLKPLIPYGRHQIDQSDIDAVVDVLQSDWLTTALKSVNSRQPSPDMQVAARRWRFPVERQRSTVRYMRWAFNRVMR